MKHLLRSNGFWVLNKQVVAMLGLETAFVLSVLSEAEELLADENGWFYQTIETLESITGLSRYKQKLAIDQLLERNILTTKVMGVPAKRHFRLDYTELSEQFVKNSQTSMSNVNKLVCEKLTTNKEHTYKEHIYKDIVELENSTVPYKEIIDYLNEKANRQFKVVESHKRHIRARWNEGYRLEDFKKVVDNKTQEWLNDKKMNQYLRPQTLFGTKFDSYLNTTTKLNKDRKGIGEYT